MRNTDRVSVLKKTPSKWDEWALVLLALVLAVVILLPLAFRWIVSWAR
jgi:hypothetical protein